MAHTTASTTALVAAALLLGGCTDRTPDLEAPGPGALVTEPNTVYFLDGATARIPAEPGWRREAYTAGQVVLGRVMGRKDHTAYASVRLVRLPKPVETAEALMQAVDAIREPDDPERFTGRTRERQPVAGSDPPCLRGHERSEDRGAKGAAPFLVLEIYERICRHPTQPDAALAAQYSERYPPGQAGGDVAARAEGFLAGVRPADHADQMFSEGLDLEINGRHTEAAARYRTAADAGHNPARVALAHLHRKGTGVPKDPARAHNLALAAAEAGDGFAMFQVADDLLRGDGVAQDRDAALAWLERAAGAGSTEARAYLGHLYLEGDQHVPQDHVAARRWLEMAVAYGDPRGFLNLGRMVAEGLGGPADPMRAYVLYRLAARHTKMARDPLKELTRSLTQAQREEGERRAREALFYGGA